MHELCYATSKSPVGGFRYGGVIISNCDLPADRPDARRLAYGGNNHGSIVEIAGRWYIFYHRQTNGSWYSRQGCAEPIRPDGNGAIAQVELTSCGLNGGPLEGRGEYPAYIACHLFTDRPAPDLAQTMGGYFDAPRVTQEGRDGDPETGYIANIKHGTTIGFRYFRLRNLREIGINVRGYASGAFHVRTAPEGPVLATLPVRYTNVWKTYTTRISLPDGVYPLYFTYTGDGQAMLGSILLK